jgi:hypothetical protein
MNFYSGNIEQAQVDYKELIADTEAFDTEDNEIDSYEWDICFTF